jgi:hypothetical protein
MNKQNTLTSLQSLFKSSHLLEVILLLILIVLSLLGIYIMKSSPSDGYLYWIVMIFIFGMAAMLISFTQAKLSKEHVFRDIWIEQSLHWLGAILAMCGVVLLLQAKNISLESTSLVMMLILSLATYLDGIRIGWRFSLVGNYLGLAMVAIAFLDNFMWVLYLIAIITVALVAVHEKRQAQR